MKIISLALKNFRNYEEALISFESGINLIVGENGSGKTNLLEALYVFITGRSFRTHRLSDLISFGKTYFSLELTFIKNDVEQTLKLVANNTQRKIYYNGTQLTQLSSLLGILHGVILSPRDSELVTGQPNVRRHFLDLHCSQVNSQYLYHLSRYVRATKQRNILLRKQETQTIEIWEEEMAVSAHYLTLERKKVIQQLDLHAKPFQAHLSRGQDHLLLTYSCQSKDRSDIDAFYREQYKIGRSKELEYGYTITGPHKDDMHIFLRDKEAKVFGSIGQIRSTALSLRFAEFSRFKQVTEETPLFFLDDLAMGLDKEREKNLYGHIVNCDQSFLTSPNADVLSGTTPPLVAHVILVKQGKLS